MDKQLTQKEITDLLEDTESIKAIRRSGAPERSPSIRVLLEEIHLLRTAIRMLTNDKKEE